MGCNEALARRVNPITQAEVPKICLKVHTGKVFVEGAIFFNCKKTSLLHLPSMAEKCCVAKSGTADVFQPSCLGLFFLFGWVNRSPDSEVYRSILRKRLKAAGDSFLQTEKLKCFCLTIPAFTIHVMSVELK